QEGDGFVDRTRPMPTEGCRFQHSMMPYRHLRRMARPASETARWPPQLPTAVGPTQRRGGPGPDLTCAGTTLDSPSCTRVSTRTRESDGTPGPCAPPKPQSAPSSSSRLVRTGALTGGQLRTERLKHRDCPSCAYPRRPES